MADDADRPGRVLEITMKYSPERARIISGVKRISKPGLRVYIKADQRAPRARRPGRGRPVHQSGTHHRPRGAPAPGRRRGPLLRLVEGDRHVPHRTIAHPRARRRRGDHRRPPRHGQGPQGHRSSAACPARSPSARTATSCVVERPDDERQNRALHGLTRSLVNNMVVGVTDGFTQGPRDRRRRLPGHRPGRRQARAGPRASATRSGSRRPTGVSFEVSAPTTHRRHGHRQGAGRPGGRQHPQDPQARALQGQGRALRDEYVARKAGKTAK